MEYVKQLRMEDNNNVKDCYTFDILQRVNYIINNIRICTHCLIQDLRSFCHGFEPQNTVFIARARSSLSVTIISFGLERKLGSRLQSCAVPRQLTLLSCFPVLHCLADQMMCSCIAGMMRLSSYIASSGPWWHLWWAFSLWSWPSAPRAWQSKQKPWRSASSLKGEKACGKQSTEAAPIGTHVPAEPVSWRRRWKGLWEVSERLLPRWQQKPAQLEDSEPHRLYAMCRSDGQGGKLLT